MISLNVLLIHVFLLFLLLLFSDCGEIDFDYDYDYFFGSLKIGWIGYQNFSFSFLIFWIVMFLCLKDLLKREDSKKSFDSLSIRLFKTPLFKKWYEEKEDVFTFFNILFGEVVYIFWHLSMLYLFYLIIYCIRFIYLHLMFKIY